MPIMVENKEARARVFKTKTGSVTLMPGVVTQVSDADWKEIESSKVAYQGKQVAQVEMLEDIGAIEVQGKAKKTASAGEAGVSPITEPAPTGQVVATTGAFPGDGGDDITKRYDDTPPDTNTKKKK